MPSSSKEKSGKTATPKSAKAKAKDAPNEATKKVEDTVKVANSNVKADAPAKKPRKRVAGNKDEADKVNDVEKGAPIKKTKTSKAKNSSTENAGVEKGSSTGTAIEVKTPETAAAKKKKGAKDDKAKTTSPTKDEPPATTKATKGKAGKAKTVDEGASTAKQLADGVELTTAKVKKSASKKAPKDSVDGDIPSIEEASKNLLEAAKETAADAFKKTEAVIAAEEAAPKSGKGKKRKATEEANPSTVAEAEISAPAAVSKKQKKSKSTAEKVVSSISDRVSSFLNTIGDAVGGKSIADDIIGVADDTVEAKAGEKKKGTGKVAGKRDKAKAEPLVEEVNQDEEDEWEPDDQTADLIRGFESDEEDKASGDEGFKEGKALPGMPSKKGLSKKLKDAKSSDSDEPGVIYVGRVPHGFHEHQMRAYFSQFGDINHVRLSRNKKTGRSKHYAFLEFASGEVAKIVADTMNNYLLFGSILKCSVVPKEQVHPNLWIGADKRFKSVPWAKLEGRKLAEPKGRSEWDKKVEKENARREKKAAELKQKMGYEVELPTVQGTASVPKKGKGKAKEIEGPKEEEVEEKTIVVGENGEDGGPVVSEEIKTKKGKKGKTTEKKVEKPSKERSKKNKANEEEKADNDDSRAPKTPKPAKEAKTGEPASSKRTPKPSKRALEAQEFEATAPKKRARKAKE